MLAAVMAVAASLVAPAPARAETLAGSLTQLSGTFGCFSDGGLTGCAAGRALRGAASVAVGPSGRDVYTAANASSAISHFRREPRSGVLRQRGCVSSTRAVRCTPGRGLTGAFHVALSPDGLNVYVAAYRSLAVFERNPVTGALTQLSGPAGCISQDVADGCARGRALASASSVAVSPDGRSVYVASVASDAVAVLAREPGGAVVQRPGPEGCVSQRASEGCDEGRALSGAFSVALSPDGLQVYVAALHSNALSVLRRDPGSGALTQLRADDACLSQGGSDGCADGYGLASPNGVSVSPDGRNVYVASSGSGAVVALARDPFVGAVDQLGGTRGCTSQNGTEGCATGRALGGAFAVTTSLDGANAYAISSSGVITFLRDPRSGALVQSGEPSACATLGGTETCTTGRALQEASSVALAPDGRNAYVTAYLSNALSTFARSPQRVRLRIAVRGIPRGCVRRSFRARIRVESTLPMRRVGLRLNRRSLGTREGTRRIVVRLHPRVLGSGRHRLKIDARDVGGNVARRSYRFRRCRS